jgi:hypothetical protein
MLGNPLIKLVVALLATLVVVVLAYAYVKLREVFVEYRVWTAPERKRRKDPDEIFTRWVEDFKSQPISVMRDGKKA